MINLPGVTPLTVQGFELACPICGGPLAVTDDVACCPACRQAFPYTDGIWRFLPLERASAYQAFMTQYHRVRADEGWGNPSPDYYPLLPWVAPTDPQQTVWSLRAQHYQTFIHKILEPLEKAHIGPLRILDLGAGNGWLANRLSQRGHDVAAVDISLDPLDGLAARACYESTFLTLQAEFDHLPLAPGQVDLVIYNGSFHYSGDYQASLQAAFRVMKPDGQLVIMDSPFYDDQASGEAMVTERHTRFKARYGFTSDALASQDFLTWQQMEGLNRAVSCSGRTVWPMAAWKRTWHKLKGLLAMQREPAQFPIVAVTPYPVLQTSPLRELVKRLWVPFIRLRYRWAYQPRSKQPYVENVDSLPLLIYPEVFNPRLFHSGEIFAEQLNECLVPAGCSVLDMGTGTGIGAITAARWASRVLAVDINPSAVRCAQDNVQLRQVQNRVEVRLGDLFACLGSERFDVVLFNPPFLHGTPAKPFEQAFFSTDVADHFAEGLADHLNPGGYALLILSSMGETGAFLQALRRRGFRVCSLVERDLITERFTLYQATHESMAHPSLSGVPSATSYPWEGDDDHLV